MFATSRPFVARCAIVVGLLVSNSAALAQHPPNPNPPADQNPAPQLRLDQFELKVSKTSMKIGETADVELILHGTGQPSGARRKVAARLSAIAFAVSPGSDEEQSIGHGQDLHWNWQLQAMTAGSQTIKATMTSHVVVNNQTNSHEIGTLSKPIVIEATPTPNPFTSFVAKNWQWLWAAILVPGATFLWNRRRKKQRRTTT
jgi:hypothetical protein